MRRLSVCNEADDEFHLSEVVLPVNSMDYKGKLVDIDVKKKDVVVSVLKGYLSSLPVLGPIVAEMIDDLIPNQRIDRIAALLKTLESKIDPEEKAKVEARMLEEKSVDLMEDGFLQAARVLSEERIDHIASLLKNSLTDEDLERSAYKRLLFLLGEVNDIEVIILKSYSIYGVEQQEFWEKHEEVLIGDVLTSPASQLEVDENAIYKTYRANLARLGLLEIKSEQPNQNCEITSLGRLLLRSIDQGEEMSDSMVNSIDVHFS